MGTFEEGMELLESICGHGKDNVIALSTIAETPGGGQPRPRVRDVDAFYENGVFYITTYALSKKMKELAANPAAAFAVPFEGITGEGAGENLGWVLKPENGELRTKLRSAFAAWYDAANDEQDENCVILAIRMTEARIFKDHGAVRYTLDLVRKTVMD